MQVHLMMLTLTMGTSRQPMLHGHYESFPSKNYTSSRINEYKAIVIDEYPRNRCIVCHVNQTKKPPVAKLKLQKSTIFQNKMIQNWTAHVQKSPSQVFTHSEGRCRQ